MHFVIDDPKTRKVVRSTQWYNIKDYWKDPKKRDQLSKILKEFIAELADTTPSKEWGNKQTYGVEQWEKTRWPHRDMSFLYWELRTYETGKDKTFKDIILKACNGKPSGKQQKLLDSLHPEIREDIYIYLNKIPKDQFYLLYIKGQILSCLEYNHVAISGRVGDFNLCIEEKQLPTNPKLWKRQMTYETSETRQQRFENMNGDPIWRRTPTGKKKEVWEQVAFRQKFGMEFEKLSEEEEKEIKRNKVAFKDWYYDGYYGADERKIKRRLYEIELTKRHLHSGGVDKAWCQARYETQDPTKEF